MVWGNMFRIHQHVCAQKLRSAVALRTSPPAEEKSGIVRKHKNVLFKVDALYKLINNTKSKLTLMNKVLIKTQLAHRHIKNVDGICVR